MPRKNIPTDVFKHINMQGGDTEQCWPWKGKLNAKDQRPYFTIDGKRRPACAIVLEVYSGEKQGKRLACHSCDNGPGPVACCSPYHLGWGTHQQNMDEMKDRDRHGLSKTCVRAIHKLLHGGQTHSQIAELYGVSRETITAIHSGRTHKGVDTKE